MKCESQLLKHQPFSVLLFCMLRSSSDIQTLFKTELSFIESCLRNNPKSYGCWHHR